MKLGIMGNSLRPIVQQGMIYGYDVAANELIDNIFKFSNFPNIKCICEPNSFQQAMLMRKKNKALKNTQIQAKEIDYISEYDLLFGDIQVAQEINVFHNVSSEFIPMIALREYIKKHIPVVWTIHCASYPNLLSEMFLSMNARGLKSYDTMICTSSAVMRAVQHILERVEKHTNKKCKVRLVKIPLGIDTTVFRPLEKAPLRDKYGIPKDAFVLLWLGRFSPGDKADLFPLLLTFRNLIQNNKDRKLLLVLAGYQPPGSNYVEILKQSASLLGIQDNLVLLNNHDISKRHELYNICDVFTSPIDNIQETFGITPIEAMACGIPQVVSDWDGYKDTVQDGVTGFRVKTMWCNCLDDLQEKGFLPSDPVHRTQLHHYIISRSVAIDIKSYENAIQLLISTPDLCNKMGEQSRKRAVTYYDWGVIISQMDNLWHELIEVANNSKESFFKDSFLLPAYCSDFRCYPTSFIDENSIFYPTDLSKSISIHSIPDPYNVEKHLGDLQLYQSIIGMSSCTIETLKLKYPSYTEDQLKRAVMYLYKNGMLYTGD